MGKEGISSTLTNTLVFSSTVTSYSLKLGKHFCSRRLSRHSFELIGHYVKGVFVFCHELLRADNARVHGGPSPQGQDRPVERVVRRQFLSPQH